MHIKAGIIMLFSNDLKRAILNKKMLFSLVISFICLIVGSYESLFLYSNTDFADTYFNAICTGTSCIFALLYPLLACVPYADIYSEEYKTGYTNYVFMKVSKKRYILSKVLSCGIGGGVAVSLPTVVFLIISVIKNGTSIVDSTIVTYITHGQDFFINSPILYCVLYSVNSFICGFIFSVLGLVVSTYTQNKYLIMLIPFAFFIFSAMFFANSFIDLNPITLLDINSYEETNIVFNAIYKIAVLMISYCLFYRRVAVNEE